MAQYLRQKGTNEVFAIINGGAYYVDHDYAVKNNVFPQVQEVTYRIDQRYPLSGPVSSAPGIQSTPQPSPVATPSPVQPQNPPSVNSNQLTNVGQNSSASVSGGQTFVSIRRDLQDNIYGIDANGKEHKLVDRPGDPLHAFSGGLNINANFVPRGSTVPLAQARTGQLTGSDGTGMTETNDGSNGTDFTNPDWYMSFGITKDMWDQLDDGTKAFVESTAKTVKGQYDSGMINVSVNADLLNKAMQRAESDPDIINKYGDALKLNQADLDRNLALINEDYAQTKGLLGMKHQQEQQALADQEAEAGRAYSGFRNKATERLASTQSAVIQSSKRELQSKINQLGGKIEGLYGSQGLSQFSPLRVDDVAYNPVGGVVGTNDASKRADILAEQTRIFNNTRLS